MKRFLLIFFLLAALRSTAQVYPWVPLTNHLMIIGTGDSFEDDRYGNRMDCYLDAYFICANPNWGVSPRSQERSGADNWEQLTNSTPKIGMAHAYAAQGKTNLLILLRVSSNNGSTDSNGMFGIMSQEILWPYQSYNQSLVLTQDWSQSTNLISREILGDWPPQNLDPNLMLRNNGASNVARLYNIPFIDSGARFTLVSNDLQAGITNWYPLGHLDDTYHFMWYADTLKGNSVDTNVWTMVLDWNSTTPSQTNHCAVASITNGASFSFTFHLDRMANGYDKPDANHTNDCRRALLEDGSLSNALCEIVRVTNAPPGNYSVLMDGNLARTATSAELAAGINFFTEWTNALWNQKIAVLDQVRIMKNINPLTAGNGSDPSNPDHFITASNYLEQRFGSYAGSRWPTNSSVNTYGALMMDRETELFGQDQVIHATAQQTNHTLMLVPIIARYAPFHR